MIAAAWDIETCPLPVDSLPDIHKERLEKEVTKQQDQNPDMGREEASKRARSFHPYREWITCISVVRGEIGESIGEPYSWCASSPEEEAEMLRKFWDDLAHLSGRPRWATYNGKDFDVPFVTARSSYYGIPPSRDDLLDTYPFNHEPHTDLSKVWLSVSSSLEEMCAHLGVPSPKAEGMDGSGVAEAVSKGHMDKVEEYCERDAVATYRCMDKLQPII